MDATWFIMDFLFAIYAKNVQSITERRRGAQKKDYFCTNLFYYNFYMFASQNLLHLFCLYEKNLVYFFGLGSNPPFADK